MGAQIEHPFLLSASRLLIQVFGGEHNIEFILCVSAHCFKNSNEKIQLRLRLPLVVVLCASLARLKESLDCRLAGETLHTIFSIYLVILIEMLRRAYRELGRGLENHFWSLNRCRIDLVTIAILVT